MLTVIFKEKSAATLKIIIIMKLKKIQQFNAIKKNSTILDVNIFLCFHLNNIDKFALILKIYQHKFLKIYFYQQLTHYKFDWKYNPKLYRGFQ